MDWLLAMALVGLLGFLIEVRIDHQKQTTELRQEGKQAYEQIQLHQTAVETARANAKEVRPRVTGLEKETEELRQTIAAAREKLAELKQAEQRRRPTRYRIEKDEEDEGQGGAAS
jgi:chromosome segregation ATPase